ncbi:MAG: hypothetical protein ACYTFW_05175 [Planctomycetota bacterium]|jgi:hypothetical protein
MMKFVYICSPLADKKNTTVKINICPGDHRDVVERYYPNPTETSLERLTTLVEAEPFHVQFVLADRDFVSICFESYTFGIWLHGENKKKIDPVNQTIYAEMPKEALNV